jgi:hypothetical protein
LTKTIYAWLSNKDTLRKEGDKQDPYAVFARDLTRGKPPGSIKQFLKESEELAEGEDE